MHLKAIDLLIGKLDSLKVLTLLLYKKKTFKKILNACINSMSRILLVKLLLIGIDIKKSYCKAIIGI